jgi:PKD repeat protein
VRRAAETPRILASGDAAEGRTVLLRVAGGGSFAWDFDNDGTFDARGKRVSHRFSNSGNFKIRLMRLSSSSSRSSQSRATVAPLRVLNRRPAVSLGRPAAAERGIKVTFDAVASDPSPRDQEAGFTYVWNFGDGKTRSGRNLSNPKHSYSRTGVYNVSVVALDRDGARSRADHASIRIVKSGESGPPETPPGAPPANAGPVTSAAPAELVNDVIANPGIGWQSCDRVNTSGRDAQGFYNRVAFIKYYWKDIETADNVYNWSKMDSDLTRARNSGQTWAFRIIVVEPQVDSPAWLRTLGIPGYYFTAEGGPQVWTPDFNDAGARQKHFEFLQAVGQRYDGQAGVESIDIGTVGMWGEWHFGDTSPAVPMPSQANLNLIIDKYFEYFPSIPKIAQLEHQNSLTYAVGKGAGFRGDCWGNMQWQNRISPAGMYAQRISGASAQNAWRNAPLAMEVCWTMSHWVNQGWDTNYILQWAIDNHVSQVHNKNSAVPASMMAGVNNLLAKIGYRYVLKKVTHAASARAGDTMTISLDMLNKGNAPSYANHRLGVQIRRQDGSVASTIITPTQVKNWMPGAFIADQNVTLPSNLADGQYTIAVGIVDPANGQPKVQLASAGKDAQGWYPLTTLRIQSEG